MQEAAARGKKCRETRDDRQVMGFSLNFLIHFLGAFITTTEQSTLKASFVSR